LREKKGNAQSKVVCEKVLARAINLLYGVVFRFFFRRGQVNALRKINVELGKREKSWTARKTKTNEVIMWWEWVPVTVTGLSLSLPLSGEKYREYLLHSLTVASDISINQ